MCAMQETLTEPACAQAGTAAGLPALLLRIIQSGASSSGSRWVAESCCAIRCLAALSAHEDSELQQLRLFVPLVCNELRKAGELCPVERLVNTISLQLHAVYCLGNYAVTSSACCQTVAASAAPGLLKQIVAKGAADGVLETQTRSLLDTLGSHMLAQEARVRDSKTGGQNSGQQKWTGGFGVPVKSKVGQ